MNSRLSIILVCVLCLFSCRRTQAYIPRHVEPAKVNVERFDSALLSIGTTDEDPATAVSRLYDEHPFFMPLFAEDIIGITDDTAALAEAITLFLADTTYGFKATNERVQSTFADISGIRHELSDAFGRLVYLYPDTYVPNICFFVSGFNASILFYNELKDGDLVPAIGVGLDMYLGSDYEYYNRVVYNYQKQTMRPECIAADVMSCYLFHLFPFESKKNRLIDNMLYRGKIMYLLSLLLPEEQEYEVMGYKKEQWQWCEQHERDIWHTMMDKHDLFKTDQMLISSYLNDGPFTSELSQLSPARVGTWIGWRIARAYMQNNSDKTLQDLIANNDAQELLEMSGYRP